MQTEERRRHPRFKMIRPAVLKIRQEARESSAELGAVVQNAAIDGLLVITQQALPLGTEVDVTITMPNELETSCAGTVVRVISDASARGAVGLAIECTRPFSDPVRRTKLPS